MIYLLYSLTQKAYHRCDAEEMIEDNLKLLKQRIITDYVVIAIANNDKEANENFYKVKEQLGRP